MADLFDSSTQTKPLSITQFRVRDNNIAVSFINSSSILTESLEVGDVSSIAEKLAVLVRPPRQGDTYRIAVTTSSVVYNIPSGWTQKMITLKAVEGDLQYQFGGSGDTLSLTLDQASAGTPPALTVDNATGATLSNGESVHFRINDETQLAVIASAACKLEMWLSSQPHTVS